ncbi:hypothetical protein [Moorena sp. SIO3B2]|nr:hypothetical protein [Moorena sp. SIO3B2]NEP35573.1 hypothetical protein [Moorena sp. SIO3B2]
MQRGINLCKVAKSPSAPCSRLDAVAHGGNPQDRAASLLPAPYFNS